MEKPIAKFGIGQIVRHRMFPFRGVIYDVDPQFANTEAWWEAIPEGIRPRKDQPFYHLLAENDESHYMAYVSEQNLLPDMTGEPEFGAHEIAWYQGVCALQYRSERARIARLALSLTTFRESAGRWPAGLAELDVPAALRCDPLTGRDVSYSSEGDLAVLGPSAWGERVDRWERLDESPYLWVLRARADARE